MSTSYMHKFSVSKDMNFIGDDKRWKDCVVGKLSEPLCLTLIITQMSAHYVLVGSFMVETNVWVGT